MEWLTVTTSPAPVASSHGAGTHSPSIRRTVVNRAARDVRQAALSRGGNDGKSGLEARPMLPQLGLAQVNLVVPAHAMPAWVHLNSPKEPIQGKRLKCRVSQQRLAVIDLADAVDEGYL